MGPGEHSLAGVEVGYDGTLIVVGDWAAVATTKRKRTETKAVQARGNIVK